jgi:cytochrome c oxidase cbb3-type subunit III
VLRITDVRFVSGVFALLVVAIVVAGATRAQTSMDPSGKMAGNPPPTQQAGIENKYLKVPLVSNIPGGIRVEPGPANPMAGDPGSVERGMKYFIGFNCVGCHAPNGGGGMGPSLSDGSFKFGSDPANHFLVIAHGAPLGMPAWGELLPETVIWDLVSYIGSISNPPSKEWGTTFSPLANLPAIEQVPAEFNESSRPWQSTVPFSGPHASKK